MEVARIPENEPSRLAALYGYNVLDTEQEGIFDELTDLAASLFDAPIALISLIDESRQWFKSRVGLDAKQTSRDVAFCSHAILQPEVFVLPDTLNDKRFADNPLVTGPPHIRFYAGAPLFTADGHGLGTLCIIDREPREISKKQQKFLSTLRTHVLKLLELRRLTRELDVSHRELESFSYSISHELRSPLRAISGYSQILLDDFTDNLNSEAKNMLERIRHAGEQMDHVTSDIVKLARLSRQSLNIRHLDLSEIAREVLSRLAHEDKEHEPDFEIQPGLMAFGDAGLLAIVLTNLFDNAWKFTLNSEQPLIEFGGTEHDGKTEFFVRDNGIGFEMAYAGKLFQPFQRLHKESDYPGTGVGLATAKRIIERHGGKIRAQSTINMGTTIYFTLNGASE